MCAFGTQDRLSFTLIVVLACFHGVAPRYGFEKFVLSSPPKAMSGIELSHLFNVREGREFLADLLRRCGRREN